MKHQAGVYRLMSFGAVNLAVFLVIYGLCQAGESIRIKSCKEHPQLSGPCFKLRGRLSIYNGTPSLRIWPVGTTRLLGISEGRFAHPDIDNIPPHVRARLGSLDDELFAEFTVCPFANDKPGVMRLICVESATNIVLRQRNEQ
jgi:hypothetical protein